MNKSWLYVAATSILELAWLYGFKEAYLWWHWIIIVIMVFFDLQFLAKACEGLPAGTVYAIFAAVGTIGTVLMDFFLFNVPITQEMMLFMGVILAGVIGLNLSDEPKEATDDATGKREYSQEAA